MKRWIPIACVMCIVMFSACNRAVETRHGTSLPSSASPELQAVDSLMWQRPDSALAMIVDYFARRDALNASPNDASPNDASSNVSPQNGINDSIPRRKHCVSTAYNDHYAHLLLAELLYKNDYAQTNREELRQAVAYFDSLTLTLSHNPKPRSRHSGLEPPSPNPNDDLFFLAARAHYINGVGYYERDSVVEACKEYIKALETMEGHFEEKELVGHKVRFMSHTFNRLGDLFYSQFMPESAIVCFKRALFYCKTEPTSKYGIPVLLYNIGIQFDISKQVDSADFYYNEALANMPDHDNFHYRDILTSKALLAYNNGHCVDSVLTILKFVISLASNDDEKLTRFLTLGNILFEDMQYDSSKRYLKAVFEQQEDVPSKVTAAQNLCSIYKVENDTIIAQTYASYLAGFTMTEFEKKTDISKTNEMLQEYLGRKQKKQAEDARQESIRKTIEIIIPIAIVFSLVIICMIKLRSMKLLNKQQEEANRMLGEKERSHQRELEIQQQTHKMQQAALSGRLKRSNEDLRDVKNQLEQMMAKNVSVETASSDNYQAFVNSPICLHIIEVVHKRQFKSKMDYQIYKDYALSKDQLLAMRNAAKQYLPQFISNIRNRFPSLTDNDMDYCYLILLGLNEADISALLQKAYSTVCDRSRKINRIVEATNSLYHTLTSMLSV